MDTIQARRDDRIARKAENCILTGREFDRGRASVGTLDARYFSEEEANVIETATEEAIAFAGDALKAPPKSIAIQPFNLRPSPIVKLSGV